VLHLFEPVASPIVAGRFHRGPAIPVVCAAMLGVLVDRLWSLSGSTWLLFTAGTVFVGAMSFAMRRRTTSAVLLLSCVGLGATWHHWRWSCLAENDLSAWASDGGLKARLKAKVLQAPLILKEPDAKHAPWRAAERTTTVIECRALVSDSAPPQPVSGLARLAIDGRFDELSIGDVIEITGELVRPAKPANAGDFDAREWLRAQGLHCLVAAQSVDAVRIVARERNLFDWLAVVRARARRRAEDLITGHLHKRTAPVAQSLLLGSRVDLDHEMRRAFAESGTLHVLAISGMNVGLLWGWLWFLCRGLRLSASVSLIAVITLLPAYAVLTDANPPVVRATIVAVVLALGQLTGRGGSAWNSLALAALFVLAWNPSDLFNAGAQLSFLAVFAILLAMSFLRALRGTLVEADTPLEGGPLWSSGLTWLIRKLTESYAIGAAIWLVTSPLIASQFHLVSPIGLVVNVLLSPLIAVMFWLGYSFLLLGLVSSVLFGWLGAPFDLTLGWFLSAVMASARLDLGHVYVSAPPVWWLVGFYGMTLSLALFDRLRGRIFWSPRAALAWIVLGLAASLRVPSPRGLTCTVLSVGHGLSVLIECPHGGTLLYDAGGMAGGNRVARTVEMFLWSTGHARLDAIVVSHADADHCNAIPELVQVLPARTLFVHRTFLDWNQWPVAETLDKSTAARVDIRLLAAGQNLSLDPEVAMRVLHPAPDFHSTRDNPNSLVLCIEYAGRRIVLTGDLESEGLTRLVRTPRLDIDVLLAPHHGSLKANPPDLARWATPEWVIASASDPVVEQRLAARYGPATQVLSTSGHGAIRCHITPDGILRVEPFRTRRR
jgi:competence protein ComEC